MAADGSGLVRPRGSPPLPQAPQQQLVEPPADVSAHIIVVCDDMLGSLPLFLYPIRQVSDRDVVVLSRRDPWELVRALAELRPPPRPAHPQNSARADAEHDTDDGVGLSSQRELVVDDDATADAGGSCGGGDVSTVLEEEGGDGGSWCVRLDSEQRARRTRSDRQLLPRPQWGRLAVPAVPAVTSSATTAGRSAVAAAAATLPSSVSRRLPKGVGGGGNAGGAVGGGVSSPPRSLLRRRLQQQPQQPGGRLFFVRGSAMSARDLRRARLSSACRVVIFNLGGQPLDGVFDDASGGGGGHDACGSQAAGLARGGLEGGGTPELEEPVPGGGGSGGSGESGGARDFTAGCVYDAQAVLATVYIESRLARTHPTLVAAITTEISSSAAFRLMGPVPDLRLQPPPPPSAPARGQAPVQRTSAPGPRQQPPPAATEHESHRAGTSGALWQSQSPPSSQQQQKLQRLQQHRPTGTAASELERVKSARRVIYVPFLSTDSELAAAAAADVAPLRQQPLMPPPLGVGGHGGGGDDVEAMGGHDGGGGAASPSPSAAPHGGQPPRMVRSQPQPSQPPQPSQKQQDPTDGHWRFVLGYKWSSRYAAGRLFPTSFVNRLLGQAFFNPQLLSLADSFAQGDALRLRHMSIPHALLHDHAQSGCCAAGSGGGGGDSSRLGGARGGSSGGCRAEPPLRGHARAVTAPPVHAAAATAANSPPAVLDEWLLRVPPAASAGSATTHMHDAGRSRTGSRAPAAGAAAAAPPPAASAADVPLCACLGSSWPRVFVHLVLHQYVVPLGLFRDRRWLGSALPYVHTNPSLSARCRPGDVAFVVVPVLRERTT